MIKLINSLIGKPYKDNAYGPDEFDCWGLACFVQEKLFNRQLPHVTSSRGNLTEIIYKIRNHPERNRWKLVEEPVHGCLVELSHSKHPHHIGVWLDIDGGGILHCQFGTGVSFDPSIILTSVGWRKVEFYDWNS